MKTINGSKDLFAIRYISDLCSFIERTEIDPTLSEYKGRVFDELKSLKPGQSIHIDAIVKSSNVELFVQCVTAFIWLNYTPKLYFSDDYERILCE